MRAKTARLIKWSNIDPEARTWTPPFADLKERHHKRPFIIPLNDIALDVLNRPRTSRFVFGSLSESILNSFLRGLRRRHRNGLIPATVSGLSPSMDFARLSAPGSKKSGVRTALSRSLSLGHKVHGEVAARYIRTGLVEERRGLLDLWSRHLRGETAEVIQIFRRGKGSPNGHVGLYIGLY